MRITAALLTLLAISFYVYFVSGATAMLPPDWASPHQKDIAADIASAVAGTDVCDYDVDPDAIAKVIDRAFGSHLSPTTASYLMYMTVVLHATQGVVLKDKGPAEIRDWCKALVHSYGKNGMDLKGLIVDP